MAREKPNCYVASANYCTSPEDCKGREVQGETEGVRTEWKERQKTRKVDDKIEMVGNQIPGPSDRADRLYIKNYPNAIIILQGRN